MGALVKLDSNFPLRAYPEKDLNEVILTRFIPYLVKLLSLKDERASEQLEMAIPALKQQCLGMGFSEINKMFELYVDNKLSIEPIPNYFDRILLGKIIVSYRKQKVVKKEIIEVELTEQEIEDIMTEAIDRLKKEVEQLGYIDSVCKHVYEYLYEKGDLPKHTKEFKLGYAERAKKIAKSKAMEEAGSSYERHRKLKDTIKKIEAVNSTVKNIAKRLVLEDYFKGL